MRGRRRWEIGGFISGAVLIALGAVAIYLGVDGYKTVHDELDKEYIVGGSDMYPEEIQAGAEEAGLPARIELPTCDVVDEEIDTGSEARCFAQYMRIHALEGTGGLTYAQMGRFVSADNPNDPAGTSDEEAAAKDESGEPISNARRNTWVTETALATALNTAYMAEQISIFGIVVGSRAAADRHRARHPRVRGVRSRARARGGPRPPNQRADVLQASTSREPWSPPLYTGSGPLDQAADPLRTVTDRRLACLQLRARAGSTALTVGVTCVGTSSAMVTKQTVWAARAVRSAAATNSGSVRILGVSSTAMNPTRPSSRRPTWPVPVTVRAWIGISRRPAKAANVTA